MSNFLQKSYHSKSKFLDTFYTHLGTRDSNSGKICVFSFSYTFLSITN